MSSITSVAIFCGAKMGNQPIWRESAQALGQGLAAQGTRVVYGGGNVGLMGVIADAAMQAGGEVVGVIPGFLKQREVANNAITRLEVTDTMHERKWRMFELADAFVSFAGGLGTLDETFEILTWRQLDLHRKPFLICDVAGSSRGLIGAIEGAIETGFSDPVTRDYYEVIHGVPDLLARIGRP